MMRMNVVFMGSSRVACVLLDRLLDEKFVKVVGVVTQPERPSGRHLRTTPCEVARMSRKRNLPLHTPRNVNALESIEWVRAHAPDVIVVTAYGQILGRDLLRIPPLGCLNIHLSLLPAFRGAAPVQQAILKGEAFTGVSAMCMDAGMDSGPVLMQEEEPVCRDDTAGTLQERLARRGAALLPHAMIALKQGFPVPVPQNEKEVSFAPKLRKSDGAIDWSLPCEELERRVRAMNPWPVCYTILPAACRGHAGGRLRVWSAKAENRPHNGPSGVLLEVDVDGPLVAAGAGALRLTEVQPAGGKMMPGSAFCRGHVLAPGLYFGDREDDDRK